MNIVFDSAKPFDRILVDLEQSVARHSFSVLHRFPLDETLASKGHAIAGRCAVFEICNASLAAQMLNRDPAISLALPCRIAVFESAGQTRLGTIAPTTILDGFEATPEIKATAVEVERTLRQILGDAA
ncbi:MAG: DUF302 domain-containing protein [Candidatus Competibacteraceae bacterium]|nr:DUF302 domain-containing protein [Candidatus Competibacteraceae bacterium]